MPEHTIAENLQRLQTAKTAIGSAITAKGGTVSSGDGLEEFASDIATIPSGGVEFSNIPATFSLMINIKNLDVVIPSGVTAIAECAFYNCVGLVSVTIPSTVTSIGAYAFYYCSHMSYIKFESTTPPTVSNSNAWDYISTSTKILVPTGTLETYKSANNYPNPERCTYEEY